MIRDPQSIVHEIDYWKALLDDLLDLNNRIEKAAAPLVEIQVALVEVAVMSRGTASGPGITKAGELASAAMDELPPMQDALNRVLDLAQGRLAALSVELHS